MRELDVWVVGLSHKTAPVGVRECVAVSGERLAALLERLKPMAAEVVVLSTCNRTELYVASPRVAPLQLFREHLGDFPERLYAYRGVAALRYLFRVSTGLESLVVGEAQILGQVKEALEAARDAGTTGPLLEQAFQAAIAVGKRARSETRIGAGAVSVAYAAVDLARSVFGELAGRRVLVVGAGEMAELVLEHLAARGVREIDVLNRTRARAERLAARFGGQAHGMEDLEAALERADIVITSAAAPHYVVQARRVRAVVSRRDAPLFLIDIGMPRNVEPEVGRVEGAYLYNLDDLQAVVKRTLEARREELPRVEALIEEEIADYLEWYAGHRSRERIRAVRQGLEELAADELASLLRGKLRDLTPEEVEAVRRLVHRVVRKATHPLIQLAKDPEVGLRLEQALPQR